MEFEFDNTASAPPRDRNFDLVPSGKYVAYISESRVEPTKNRDGMRLKLKWVITGPTHVGRVVFQDINVRNKSAQSEQIGQQELRDIKEAIGLTEVMKDTVALHNKPVTVKVKTRQGRPKDESRPELGNYEDQNEISYVKKLETAAPISTGFTPPSAGSAPAAAATAAPVGGTKTPPWAQRKAG